MLSKIYAYRHSHATYSGKLYLLGSTALIQSLSLSIIRNKRHKQEPYVIVIGLCVVLKLSISLSEHPPMDNAPGALSALRGSLPSVW
jgi:hypothetical protein